jgi:anhydro-N-acetylmuramic acid kinase
MKSHLYTSIGLMSGTSLDGIDVAMIHTDGEDHVDLGPGFVYPYPIEFQNRLRKFIDNPIINNDPSLERDLTLFHCDALKTFLTKFEYDIGKNVTVDLIGFHGQTIFHSPKKGSRNAISWQMGDGQLLSKELSIPVVYDFRSKDIENGGEGAPLVPIFQKALLPLSHTVFLNIGGVANITYINNDDVIAFDTGPGCALMNDLMMQETGYPFDKDGHLTLTGQIHHDLVNQWIKHPFFTQLPPKSLDRNTFSFVFEDIKNLSLEDGMATLLQFTYEAIENAFKMLPSTPTDVILCGGGRKNTALRFKLMKQWNAITAEQKGWNGDIMEAYAFAYLAVRSTLGLPLSYPSTTGVSIPCTGGRFVSPV